MTAEKRQLKEIDSLINKPEEIYLLQSDQTLHTHSLSLSLIPYISTLTLKQVHLTLLYDLIYKALQTTLMDKMKPRDSLLQLASLTHQTPTWLNSSTLTVARESHVTLPQSL
jgi:hypothetical protein